MWASLRATTLTRIRRAVRIRGEGKEVDGLGDEAWRLWAHGHGREVTYHWRRDNLVTEVHVHCYGDCPDVDADVDAAARAWADGIDEEARATGG